VSDLQTLRRRLRPAATFSSRGSSCGPGAEPSA
jgi:hypothetical protein